MYTWRMENLYHGLNQPCVQQKQIKLHTYSEDMQLQTKCKNN
jgi:hypothetical protein